MTAHDFWTLSNGKRATMSVSFSMIENEAPNELDQISNFESFAQSIGLDLHGAIVDGSIHRCPIKGKQGDNKSGAYWLSCSNSGVLYGWMCNWTTGESLPFTGADENECRFFGIDYASMQKEIEAKRKEYEKEQEAGRAEGLAQSMKVWHSAKECTGHDYLTKKRIDQHGMFRIAGDKLLVPAYNDHDEVVAWQSITPDGKDKKYCKFFPSKSNAYFRFKGTTERVYICEGMATAWAVHKSTGGMVYAAFDAGRLASCAKMARSLYLGAKIIVAGDNDESGVGQNKAKEAAIGVVGYSFCPSETGKDWWDVWNEGGRIEFDIPADDQSSDVDASKFSNLPTPPYPINEVAEWVESIMPTPHRDIAIMSAWAMVAAFSGRKDSFLKNPPAVIMTLLAINGAGKDTLSKAMNRIIDALMDTHINGVGDNAGSFTTSPEYKRWLINSFRPSNPSMGTALMTFEDNGRLSGVRLTREAGLSKQSKAGDSANVRASALQNTAQDAYTQLYYPTTRGGTTPAYGVPYTVIDESTPETYVSGMMSDVSSGAVARGLMIRIDVSKSGPTDYLADFEEVPQRIVYIFHRLIEEAARGERRKCDRPEMMDEDIEKSDSKYFISDVPVPLELRRIFKPDDEAKAAAIELSAAQDRVRQSNKSNDASLEWAHAVRRPQIIFRMALIAARTRVTVDGLEPVVTGDDMRAAIDFVDECHRVSMANSSDYDNKYNRAAVALREWLVMQFSKKNPTAAYSKHGTSEMFKSKVMPYSVLGACGMPGWKKLFAEISEQSGKSPWVVYKEVATIGDANKYWSVSEDWKMLTLI